MARVYTYRELKESKIIYDRKPPAFGVVITFMTLIFAVAAVFWAAFSTKTYVVKANGLATSTSKVNVMNKVSGSIDALKVVSGDSVKKGSVIIEINSFQTELQIAQIQANVDFHTSKANAMERLIIFIDGFTLNDEESRINPFDKTNTSELSAYSNAQIFIDYIKQQEEAAENESTEEEPKEFTQEEADNLKTNFLSQQYTSLDEIKAQVIQQESQLQMYQDSLAEYKIIAEIDGIIQLSAGLTVGTMLQAGTLLGSISSSDSSLLYFDAVISATDRAKIAVGDSVEIALGGVLQSEFGVLSGKITSIDNDSTQTEDGQVFYRVRIKPDSTKLEDKKGNVIDLSVGMLAESRIKYDETTWLNWAIEQIGIKFR